MGKNFVIFLHAFRKIQEKKKESNNGWLFTKVKMMQ